MHLLRSLFLVHLSLFLTTAGLAQADDWKSDEDMELPVDFSLAELMNIVVSTASYGEKPLREQPGVITVITEEEIKRTGARDLIDVLNLVPGFSFAGEVTEVVGIGTRGIWANEGKVLIQIDGIELNETLFGTLQFNNHISADQIRQIEIIRGPGSAMYGGTAELAVIKITTKGSEIDGGWISSDFSYNHGEVNSKFDFAGGKEYENWGFSLAGTLKEGRRSNETLKDYQGNTYDMTDFSDLTGNPLYLNFGLNIKDLDLRLIHDQYQYEFRDYYGIVPESNLRTEIFDSTLASAEYNWQVNEDLSLHPKLVYKNHPTWQNKMADNGYRWQVEATRYLGELTGIYHLPDWGEVSSLMSAGGQYYEDHGKAHDQSAIPKNEHFGGDSDTVDYDNYAIFAQWEGDSPWANLTLGGRYEDHEFAGDEFVPRVAVTKVWDKLHVKALYSEAFRTPNIEVIRANEGAGDKITSEKTTAYEAEAGYEFSDSVFWVSNIYWVEVEDPIYFAPSGFYINGDEVSSYGIESEFRFEPGWGSIKLGYSYYVADESGVPLWSTDDSDKAAGLPNHKFTYDVTYEFMDSWSLNCNGFIGSSRRSWSDPDGDWIGTPKTWDSEVITNLYLMHERGPLTLGVGVSDLFNEKQEYAPAYDNFSGAIPSMSREIFIKASWQF